MLVSFLGCVSCILNKQNIYTCLQGSSNTAIENIPTLPNNICILTKYVIMHVICENSLIWRL